MAGGLSVGLRHGSIGLDSVVRAVGTTLYSALSSRVMHTFDDAGWQPECYL